MNTSGDAAEQVVRLGLEGTEVVLKFTGSAAKNIAAFLYAVMKNRDKSKIKGRQRLTAMLKSGKELKVFTVGEEHLKQFAAEAKRYGVVYCALRGRTKSEDGLVDIMVRAEDASKINRIVERFKLAAVDTASIKSDIKKSRTVQAANPETGSKEMRAKSEKAQQDQPNKNKMDRLPEEMRGAKIGEDVYIGKDPSAARAEKPHLSVPILGPHSKAAGGTDVTKRTSVRQELKAIQARHMKRNERVPNGKTERVSEMNLKANRHKQPRRKKKTKER